MHLKLVGVFSVAPTSLEVIAIVIKDVLLHLNMKMSNHQSKGLVKCLSDVVIQTYLGAVFYLSACFEYGFFIAKKL